MDINGWFTVIAVFTAILALIPREDLRLTFGKTSRVEIGIVLAFFLFIIPYLLFFHSIAIRCPFFSRFYISNGIDPSNLAFIIFYTSFLWLIIRLFWIKPKLKVNQETIDYFLEILSEKPFDVFYKIFIKYTSKKEIENNWVLYRKIFLDPKFLSGVLIKKPSYLIQFWNKFDSKEDFQSVFRLFLENKNSIYYNEIKEHWNSYSLLPDKPFLNKVLKEYIEQSIRNGLFKIFTDFVTRHLRNEYIKTSIYNQPHYHPRVREEKGFELPIYYHIRFIGLLYSSCISDKKDISTFAGRSSNMLSIYSNIVEVMVDNVNVEGVDLEKEYPTNYHWLISEIFTFNDNWVEKFNEKRNFSPESSYNNFITKSLSFCMKELYKGYDRGKITQLFIKNMMYYHILYNYFESRDEIKLAIETDIIKEIPEVHLVPILDFALDEEFAISYEVFTSGKYGLNSERENKILDRLNKFLGSLNN